MAPPVRIGTSGWSYPEWRSGFYAGVPRNRWLAHCAAHFSAIEVNATFYRFMNPETFAKWRAETPGDFTFAVKGHRLITHRRRLTNVSRPIADMRRSAEPLGRRLAAVLWQLPANLQQDPGLLHNFALALGAWPETRHVIEFRHPSWFTDETAAVLDREGLANCTSDAADWPMWVRVTAGLAYVRLHGHAETYASAYGARGLRPWVRRINRWRKDGAAVHVYFDNTMTDAAATDALRLMKALGLAKAG